MPKFRRPRVEWQRLVSEWRKSGQKARAFAEEHGVRVDQLRWWAWRLGTKKIDTNTVDDAPPRRVRRRRRRKQHVTLIEIPRSPSIASDDRVELVFSDGRILRFAAGISDGQLLTILTALEVSA